MMGDCAASGAGASGVPATIPRRGFVVLRARIEILLAAVAGVLAVVTLVWPMWIESIFAARPDAGSGAAEWLVVSVFAASAVVLALVGVRHYRLAGRPSSESAAH
jgi:hypothetical protein